MLFNQHLHFLNVHAVPVVSTCPSFVCTDHSKPNEEIPFPHVVTAMMCRDWGFYWRRTVRRAKETSFFAETHVHSSV